MAYIENRTFDEIQVGDTANLKRVLTQRDIELFAVMSGDVNPAHVDVEYAQDDLFHKIIAHGMWSGALISAVLGTELPGPGTIYLEQTLKFERPVALGDVITVTLRVLSKDAKKHHVVFDCHCVNQLNQVVVRGVATVLAPTIKVKRRRVSLPKVELRIEKESFYQRLIESGKNLPPLVTAVVHPVDELSLRGAVVAAQEGLIVPILVGPEQKIRQAAQNANLDISAYQMVSTAHSQEAAEVSVGMARKHKVEALMKGKIHTDELMKAVIDKDKGLRTGRRMSHIFSLEMPNYFKPIFLTDTAINIFPTLEEKRDIVQNAIDLFAALGLGVPKVAIVSATETVNEKIPSTLDAAALCKMSDRGQITGGILDGPLAFDNAVSPESDRVKGISSKVSGDADIIVVPNIEAGNIVYKQMTYVFGVEAAGLVMGAGVPIILTSRGSGEFSRKISCAMALLYARSIPRLWS